uniref:Uncharacterized protein n=1 Tax=Panagrolaimus superbus TaxID=310955 RepID=A0A914YST0_9BILA
MYKGVPRYEPINKSSRPYEKSEKEVAAKIQILQPPPSSIPTSPTFPGVNNDVVKTPPKSPPVAASPAKNNGNNGGIVIGTLPKNQPSAEDPKKDGLSPVSHYVAPLDR